MRVAPARGCGCAEDDLHVLIVSYTVFVVAASLIAGSISDRTGRRKPIVIIAALVQALSAVLILMSPTFVGTAIAAAVMGVGYGAYMAVRMALATDLLPRPEHHARDLGVVNVAANLGQLLGPLLGAGLVALVGGFWLLFLVAGILSVLGGGHDDRRAGSCDASLRCSVAIATSSRALKTRGRMAVTRCEVRGTTMSSECGVSLRNRRSCIRS